MSTNPKKDTYIHLPMPRSTLIGGPYTFLRNLQATFTQIIPTKNILKAKGILFPVTTHKAFLWYYKRLGLPVIQRLDGLHYPQKHGDNYIERNKEMADIYLHKATHIIFQSNHSKQQFQYMLGKSPAKDLGIILNGAREDLFYPNTDHEKEKGILNLISTGSFRGEDMLQPMLDALDIFTETHPDIQITLKLIGCMGVDAATQERVHRTPYAHFMGKLSLQHIALELQKADAFLFTHLNPPCPNSVIEALATGLPVISFNSGAMSELCAHQTDLLAEVDADSLFHSINDFDPHRLANKILILEENFTSFRTSAIQHAQTFTMKACTSAYEKALLEAFTNIPSPSLAKKLFFAACAGVIYTCEVAQKLIKRFR